MTQYDNASLWRFPRGSRVRGLAFLAASFAAFLLIPLVVMTFGTLRYWLGGGAFYFPFLILAYTVCVPVGKLGVRCWLRN